MKIKKAFVYMIIGALLLTVGAIVAKSVADMYADVNRDLVNTDEDVFVITAEVEDRFDALMCKARRSPNFISDILKFGIDIDDFDSDFITGEDRYYVTCVLDNGYTVRLGESEVELKYQIFKEVDNE